MLLSSFLCQFTYAQKVTFDYNQNGARILRETEIQKPILQTSVEVIPDHKIQDNSIKLYPNPVKDYLYIETIQKNTNSIEIYDITGRKIFFKEMSDKSDIINMSDFVNGIYIVKISNKTFSIVKQ